MILCHSIYYLYFCTLVDLQGSYWAIDPNPQDDSLVARRKQNMRHGSRVSIHKAGKKGKISLEYGQKCDFFTFSEMFVRKRPTYPSK